MEDLRRAIEGDERDLLPALRAWRTSFQYLAMAALEATDILRTPGSLAMARKLFLCDSSGWRAAP